MLKNYIIILAENEINGMEERKEWGWILISLFLISPNLKIFKKILKKKNSSSSLIRTHDHLSCIYPLLPLTPVLFLPTSKGMCRDSCSSFTKVHCIISLSVSVKCSSKVKVDLAIFLQLLFPKQKKSELKTNSTTGFLYFPAPFLLHFMPSYTMLFANKQILLLIRVKKKTL